MAKSKDLTGQRFGTLVVVERANDVVSQIGRKYRAWRCKCDCGNEKVMLQEYLRQKKDSCSCGCQTAKSRKEKLSKPRKVHNPVGERYGRLTIVEELPRTKAKDGHMLRVMRCVCDCGNEKITKYVSLRNRHTQSCGCWWREAPLKHGGSTKDSEYKRLYHVWCAMRNRCINPDDKNYHNYGGRGIKICNEWLNDFPSFRDWALANGYDPEAPQGETTIDRIDVDGNYEPLNCRWTDVETQANNKRDTVSVTHDGETMSVSQWIRRGGTVCKSVYQNRIKKGWDKESALFTPTKKWDYRHRRYITYNGESLPMAEWSRRTGLTSYLIHDRLAYGWSIGEALGFELHETKQPKKSHPVIQYDKDGNFIREWESKKSVENGLGIISNTLNKYLKSGNVDTHGWIWKPKETDK